MSYIAAVQSTTTVLKFMLSRRLVSRFVVMDVDDYSAVLRSIPNRYYGKTIDEVKKDHQFFYTPYGFTSICGRPIGGLKLIPDDGVCGSGGGARAKLHLFKNGAF